MPAAALEEIEQCCSFFGHQEAKDRGTAQADLLADMSEDNNKVGLFLREHLSWSEKLGAYVNRIVNINGGEANNGKADNGKTHTDRFSKPANLRVLSYYMTHGQTGCLTVSVRGHSFDINVPKGCAIVCSKELLEQCNHSHGAHGRCVSIVTEVKGDRLPPDATEDERHEAAAAQEELPLLELFPTWLPSQHVHMYGRPTATARPGREVCLARCHAIEGAASPAASQSPRFHTVLLTTAGPVSCSLAIS